MSTLNELLKDLRACSEAVEWAEGKTIEEVVNTCHRGDWLLWLAGRMKIDHRKLTLAKAHCANTVRHLMKDKLSIKAVDTAIAYGNSEATIEELKTAADAAADAAYAADADAAYAAYAAAYASADAYDAGDYAASAAYAADAARKSNHLQTADICRKYIGQEIINIVNGKLK